MKKSTYTATFHNKSIKTDEHSWAEMATIKVVKHFAGGTRRVAVVGGIKMFHVKHKGMDVQLSVPDGAEIYQAIREEVIFLPNGHKIERTRGHLVGIVKDGEIIEERFMNSMDGQIYGARK